MESAFHSLPKSSDSGNDGWTDENMAELEKQLGLALGEQQVESSSACTLTSPSPRRPRHHRTRSRLENAAKPLVVDQKSCEMLVDVVPQLQGLEWEQRETRVAVESLGRSELGDEALMEEAGGVEIRQRGELAGWPAVGDQQNQVEVDDTDDPTDKEATEALPATQLEIDWHRSQLHGIRTQQLPGRQTKTTQY